MCDKELTRRIMMPRCVNINPIATKTIMTIWFISRHPGAAQWMQQQGHHYDKHVSHLDPELVQAGDTVIGTLPINMAAKICQRGAHYWHLSLKLPASARGRELSTDELRQYKATLEPYRVERLDTGA